MALRAIITYERSPYQRSTSRLCLVSEPPDHFTDDIQLSNHGHIGLILGQGNILVAPGKECLSLTVQRPTLIKMFLDQH